jgi:Protein of unknown function (DUF2442)
MAHAIYRVVSFEKVAPFTLRVHFDGGVSQLIEFRPVLKGELCGPSRIHPFFDKVQIDPEVHTLVWPNGAAFDPTILHNWPESSPALKARAEKWVLKPGHGKSHYITRRSCRLYRNGHRTVA